MEDQQGAYTTDVGDVVVGVCVEADIIAVPGDARFGITLHGTADITLIAFWSIVLL